MRKTHIRLSENINSINTILETIQLDKIQYFILEEMIKKNQVKESVFWGLLRISCVFDIIKETSHSYSPLGHHPVNTVRI